VGGEGGDSLTGGAMSDIVERLRNENWPEGLDYALRLEAAAEIERLTSNKLAEENIALCVKLREAKAEIERLRTQCEGLAQSAMNNGQDLLLKEGEIERLRAEMREYACTGTDEPCGCYSEFLRDTNGLAPPVVSEWDY
jgi:predicted RNase H-like nuclease (RuvC/YqgF family)